MDPTGEEDQKHTQVHAWVLGGVGVFMREGGMGERGCKTRGQSLHTRTRPLTHALMHALTHAHTRARARANTYPQGTNNAGERMADSTASGPLWQQRPYPAPGKILRQGQNTPQGPSMR